MNRLQKMWLGCFVFASLCTFGRPSHAIDEMRHPRLHRADRELGDASEVLKGETRPESDYGGHRARALDLIRQARLELDQAATSADSTTETPPAETGATADNAYAAEPAYDPPPPSYTPPPEPVVYFAPPPPTTPVGFWGSHPVPGGGWCLAGGPHVHYYEPEFFDQYHLVGGYFRFGEGFHEWAYAGIHPVAGGGWCTISIPHRHVYAPTVGFLYDPVRRGYYYDRERAVVIRTVVVRAPPDYRPPVEVVTRYRHPPALRAMPAGTPRHQPWARERVIERPGTAAAHAGAPGGARPTAAPAAYHPGTEAARTQSGATHAAPASSAPGAANRPASAMDKSAAKPAVATDRAAAKPAAAKPAAATDKAAAKHPPAEKEKNEKKDKK